MAGLHPDQSNQKRDLILSAVVFVVACTLGLLLGETKFGSFLDGHVAQRINYMARRALGVAPKVDPRIKIFALEDNSLAALQTPELSLKQWQTVIEATGRAGPKAIIIDKIFGFLPGETAESVRDFQNFLSRFPVPVYTGAFSTGSPISGRTPLPEHPYYKLDSYVSSEETNDISWIRRNNINIYGAHASIMMQIPRTGHIAYEGDGYVAPFLRPKQHIVVPHVALTLAESLAIDQRGFSVNGTPVRPNRNGLIPVNFLVPEQLLRSSKRMGNLFVFAEKQAAVPDLKAGDYVLLLPLMYTGNTDFKETAVGRIPGGFILASMINSTLSGNWLRVLEIRWLTILTGCLIAVAAPLFLTVTPALVAVFATFLLLITAGIGCFVYGGIVADWMSPAILTMMTGGLMVGRKYYETERALRNLKRDLRGRISSDRVAEFVKKRQKLMNEAAEQILTIMFIDMVGFSKSAMKKTPRHVFGALKGKVELLRSIVHSHGGLIDRTMGDGMLCVFGFEIDAANPNRSHADMALSCAVEMQQSNIREILKEHGAASEVFPLRIGINTAATFVGNLGDEDQLDLTVVGNGVNFAQRLESTCERNMIMVGATTLDLLTTQDGRYGPLTKRLIKIKHQDDFIEAYECNPFWNNQDTLKSAENKYFKAIGAERLEERFTVSERNLLTVECEFGTGHVMDFSRGGMGIALPKYFATGVSFGIKICSSRQVQPAIGIAPLTVEIRWAKPMADGSYLHGCEFKNLTRDQKGQILEVLRLFLHETDKPNGAVA